MKQRSRGGELAVLDEDMCNLLTVFESICVGIGTHRWKRIPNLKMDLGKNANLTYVQGGTLNHWENDGFTTCGASPIGYPSGSK